jgi:hypothetical protein
VGLVLLYGFVTVNFSGMESLGLNQTPNLEDQELHFAWPLPFDPSGMGLPYREIALPPAVVSKFPVQDKAVVLEKKWYDYLKAALALYRETGKQDETRLGSRGCYQLSSRNKYLLQHKLAW